MRKRPPTLFWVGLGVAAAGIATGSVTGLQSLSSTNSAKQHCDGNACAPAAQADIDSARTLANVSNVAFGVAVAGLAVSAWQWLAHRRDEPPPPRVSVGLGHVAVAGTF